MTLCDLSYQDFQPLFSRMKEEFPPCEMKTLPQFRHLLETGKYHCFALKENGNYLGIALGVLNEQTSIFWLDYLQIFKEYQSRKYGSQLLSFLLYGSQKQEPLVHTGILLEVEKPETTDYHDGQVKRMRFYHRFNITPVPVDYLFPSNDGGTVPLVLSFLPCKEVSCVSKEVLQASVRFAVQIIHFDVPHAEQTMHSYIDSIPDLPIHHFSMSEVNMNDPEEVSQIGELIYKVDPWVYPALFDNSIQLARKMAPFLLEHDTVYHHSHIRVARINHRIAGFIVLLESYPENNHLEMEKAFLEGLGYLPPKFDHVMTGYFDTLADGWEGTQILSLSVLEEFRRLHVATKMLDSLDRSHDYTLACVKENAQARVLYQKCGFVFKYEYPGYTGVPCVELIKRKQSH